MPHYSVYITWFLLLCWNQFPWLFQTKLMLVHYFYTCNAQKNQKVGAQIYTEGERSGQGYFPPIGGRVWGGGCDPSPEIFEILPENGAFWLHFLPYARFFAVQRGAWPKWPNGKYATAGDNCVAFVVSNAWYTNVKHEVSTMYVSFDSPLNPEDGETCTWILPNILASSTPYERKT